MINILENDAWVHYEIWRGMGSHNMKTTVVLGGAAGKNKISTVNMILDYVHIYFFFLPCLTVLSILGEIMGAHKNLMSH